MSQLIQTIKHGRIHELRLARPPVNAINPALCQALCEAMDSAIANGAEGLVLSGGPKVFSAGLDVPLLLSIQEDGQALYDAWNGFFDAARALAACPVPVAAAIAGHAPAGGCVLALCCDWRVMAEGPFGIGLNETQVGIAIPPGIMRLMQRTVGARQAEALLLAGAMVESSRALDIGLVDELAAADAVVARAADRINLLLDLPRAPMLATRKLLRADLVEAVSPASMQLEQCLESWRSADTQQALRAMVARIGKG
ncbi:MAG TPA: enoyl-CoA hydratase/isomerase family protein [Candidatus Luteimonas excrementigallinarum]|nr:enoyl-CoA hydratase/isomerase family protein [Candidatus Luteimonas excrementigallinarum]